MRYGKKKLFVSRKDLRIQGKLKNKNEIIANKVRTNFSDTLGFQIITIPITATAMRCEGFSANVNPNSTAEKCNEFFGVSEFKKTIFLTKKNSKTQTVRSCMLLPN
jgi:hypothetical protein